MTAGAFPDIKRSTPISVSGKTPVLNVFKPVAEASLTDGFGNPVYCIVICDKSVLDLCHLDEPGVTGVVDERCVTSPAMRIIMLKLWRGEELSTLLKVCEDEWVCLLNEDTRVLCLLGHLALAVNELNEGETVFSSYL